MIENELSKRIEKLRLCEIGINLQEEADGGIKATIEDVNENIKRVVIPEGDYKRRSQ